MLSSKRLELLLTLEQQRREGSRRRWESCRNDCRMLQAQRQELNTLFVDYQAKQASFSGEVSRLRQQVRLSERLRSGISELNNLLSGAEQRLAAAEARLHQHQQRCEGWQRQLTEALRRERRGERRQERRRLERSWLEGRQEHSKI